VKDEVAEQRAKREAFLNTTGTSEAPVVRNTARTRGPRTGEPLGSMPIFERRTEFKHGALRIARRSDLEDLALAKLGLRIAELRGMRSQFDLARAANMKLGRLLSIERGFYVPTVTELLRLASALSVQVSALSGDGTA
jgi:hypothetical protein